MTRGPQQNHDRLVAWRHQCKKPPRTAAFCATSGRRLLSGRRCRRLARQLFLDASRTAAALAEVIQLGAAHIATALDFDAGDQRAVGLERTFHAFAAGDLAHGEAAVEAAIAL